MSIYPITTEKSHEGAVIETFLESPSEDSFADLFNTFRSQLIGFFRVRGCDLALAEDLTQDVMLTVYRKAAQIRDRTLFRPWLFKIARHTLCRQYGKQTREVESIELTGVNRPLTAHKPSGTPAFEFHRWMSFLDSRESEVMALRFIEEWEYHEIAAAKALPIGTVQSRVFSAKKKLAPRLKTLTNTTRKAA
jgi:RNA polymerase sigma factor (sigma-70 family)